MIILILGLKCERVKIQNKVRTNDLIHEPEFDITSLYDLARFPAKNKRNVREERVLGACSNCETCVRGHFKRKPGGKRIVK